MYGLLKAYYIVLIYSIFGKFLLNVSDVVSDVLVVGFIALSVYADRFQLQIPRKLGTYCLWTTVIPAVIILVFSLAVQAFGSLSSDYLVRSTTMCVRWILYCLLALRTIHVFRSETVDVLLTACTIAYVPSIAAFFLEVGFVNGFEVLLSDNVYGESVALEVHRLTYVFGFLAVYYAYRLIVLRERVLGQMVLSVTLLALGLKRVANFAFSFAFLAILVFNWVKKDKAKYKISCAASVALVVVGLLYVYLIKSGYLQLAFNYLGVDDNFRFNFWNHISPRYEFGPGFIGKGLSYPQRFMWHEWANIQDLSAVTNLHNDILGYYIGLGFFGFCAFFGMLFLGQVALLNKWFSARSAAMALSLSLFYFIIMTTSNEGAPGFVFACYTTLILASTTGRFIDSNGEGCADDRATTAGDGVAQTIR